ncbi:hypothetical protein I4F81_008048 [Pyropia yezoensis]|uniref:Uncharacterized protein n=1 Tax=Pyropia yezoensis TaxID=2788 RepID=A0ACC3C5T8_PYRYE|nr:hypothetical protein I4F81_008048 [Neopyropia yezoensis]
MVHAVKGFRRGRAAAAAIAAISLTPFPAGSPPVHRTADRDEPLACAARQDTAPVASPRGLDSVSPSEADEPDVAVLPVEDVLSRLAPLQRRRLYGLVDVAEHVEIDTHAERAKLKLDVDHLTKRAKDLLPSPLWPLFHHKALLYRSVKTRFAELRNLLRSNPTRASLKSAELDREQVRHAVRSFYNFQDDFRGFGSVVGFPGMGKTYLMRLLLDSQAAPKPVAPEDAEGTYAKIMSWWMSLPVFDISFNGITPASTDDLLLA